MQNSSTSLQLYQQGFLSSLSCFHCVGLQHFGRQPVFRSLSRLRLFLFEARLSGYCVREGESRGLGSKCLLLAHGPCRAVGFRQDKCRVGASACACCLWFVALLHVRGSWSACVFRAVHRFCFLGSCSPLSKGPLVVKLHCVGLQHFGEREGLLAASGSGKSGCSLCFADASERGVSPRLEVGGSACFALALPSLCARSPGCGCFCLRLDFQVTVSVRGGQGSQPWVPLAHGL